MDWWEWTIIAVVSYFMGMVITEFVLGWVFRNERDIDPWPIPGTVFWPFALPVTIAYPLIWAIYKVCMGSYHTGRGQGNIHIGKRARAITGRGR